LVICKITAAEASKKVVVIPFTIHSQKDLSFLQDGIENMLATRLSLENKVVVINREQTRQALEKMPDPINQEAAILLGAELQADYVLFGSLTVFGESFSTDAWFLDVNSKKAVLTFNQYAKNRGDVIYHVNLLAQQINETIFGRRTAAVQAVPPKKEAEIDRYKHPEKLLAKDSELKGLDTYDRPVEVGKTPAIGWRSRRFKTRIKGMAVGDVDGDGRNETVFIDDINVFIHRYSDERFERIGQITGKSNHNYIGIDVADINRNGKSEIFVTNNLKDINLLSSFVLEWNDGTFKKIAQNEKLYYRVLILPGREEKVLLGQKRGGYDTDLFKGGIYELKWENNRYLPAKHQSLPKKVHVFGLTYGDVLNSGREMIVTYTGRDHLSILHKNGEEEWTSPEPFGGGMNYLEFRMESDSPIGAHKEMNRFYLPQRILITDLDKDGKNEIVVVNNVDTARVLTRTKMFKTGHIECLVWDNLGLYPKWKTRKISGYISDYTVADFDNDGQDELVYAAVPKTGVTKKERSFIVSQEIL
jgi:TolB-like protein